jgi:hypothetical protein
LIQAPGIDLDVKSLWSINRRTTVGDTASLAATLPTISHSDFGVAVAAGADMGGTPPDQ